MHSVSIPPKSATPPATFHITLVTQHDTGTADISNPRLHFFPIWIPAGVTRVRFIVYNRYANTGAALPSFTTSVAVGTVNNAATGWSGPPTVLSNFVVQSYGSNTGWINVTRNSTNGKIGVALFMPATLAANYVKQSNTAYGLYNTNSNDVVNLPGLVAMAQDFIPFGLGMEYEPPPGTKRYVQLGDSIAVGIASSQPAGLDGTLFQLGPSRGYAWCANGIGGLTMSGFVSQINASGGLQGGSSHTDYLQMQNAIVSVELGTNDAQGGPVPTNLSEGQLNSLVRILTYVRAQNPLQLWVATIPPKPIADHTQRHEFNNWVRQNWFGADYIYDRDLILRDPASPDQLLAAYKCPADSLHLSLAGYTALINQLTADGRV